LVTAASAAPASSPSISVLGSHCPVFAHKRDTTRRR
jgi:hypothetical protein